MVGHHMVCPEPNDAPTIAFHHFRPLRVRVDLEGVMFAVYLNNELPRYAGEIGEEGFDRMLAPELDACDTAIA